jgi:hypothetical protein
LSRTRTGLGAKRRTLYKMESSKLHFISWDYTFKYSGIYRNKYTVKNSTLVYGINGLENF